MYGVYIYVPRDILEYLWKNYGILRLPQIIRLQYIVLLQQFAESDIGRTNCKKFSVEFDPKFTL